LGLFNIQIGGGSIVSGSISAINWSIATYYLKIEMDANGGSSYVFMGTSQLISVPYALHAKTAESVIGGGTQTISLTTDQLTISGSGGNTITFTDWDTNKSDDVTITGNQIIAGNKTFTGTIAASNKVISDVATPVAASDAANKAYVDASKNKIFGQASNVEGAYTIPDNIDVFTTEDVSWNPEINLPMPTQANGNLFNRIGSFLLIRCRSTSSIGINNNNTNLPDTVKLFYGQSLLFVYDGDRWLNVVSSNNLVSLQTIDVADITHNSAICGGTILSDGGTAVTAKGVCWSTSENTSIALTTKTLDGSGSGQYVSIITGLTASTTYYVRAYATNASGTVYGVQRSFTTLAGIPNNGLVAYYPFNGNTNDESGNGRNGTKVSAISATDRFGNSNSAYQFDGYTGTDRYIYSNIGSHNIISFSVWFKQPYPTTWYPTIFSFGTGNRLEAGFSGNHPTWIALNIVGRFHAAADLGGGWASEVSSTSTFIDNTWHHAVVMFVPNDSLYVYIDNNLKLSTPHSPNNPTDDLLYIGKSLVEGKEPRTSRFNGSIDDIRIYDRALTQSEVTLLFNEIK
jgi:hypothetical protein